jgi:hypothetical protein
MFDDGIGLLMLSNPLVGYRYLSEGLAYPNTCYPYLFLSRNLWVKEWLATFNFITNKTNNDDATHTWG